MARKHTYSIEVDGQTFTRTTERTYTHLVVAKRSQSHALAVATSQARKDADRRNWEFYTNNSMVDHARRVAFEGIDMTCEEYVQHATEQAVLAIEADAARGYYDTWEVIGWCGRHDLARKLANSTDNNPHYQDVRVLAID